MIARLLAVVVLALCCAGGAVAQKLVTFARGAAEVSLPMTFVTTELNDGTLRAVFGRDGSSRLELTLRSAVSRPSGGTAGEAVVREEGKRKKLRVFELPGKVVLMEPIPDRDEGDKVHRTARWLIGFGDAVVLMTLTAPVEESPELKRFLGEPLNEVIRSVRLRRA